MTPKLNETSCLTDLYQTVRINTKQYFQHFQAKANIEVLNSSFSFSLFILATQNNNNYNHTQIRGLRLIDTQTQSTSHKKE